MRHKFLATVIAGTALSLAAVCNAGFLHRAYEGSFCSHGTQWAVSYDGAIIGMKANGDGCDYTSPCGGWGYARGYGSYAVYISMDKNQLSNVITDLQTIQKELNDADKEK